MLIETRLKRIAADLASVLKDFPAAFDKKDTGHLQTAGEHVQCVLRDYKAERETYAEPERPQRGFADDSWDV